MPIPKNWQNTPSTATPIDAEALEDLEVRVHDAAVETAQAGMASDAELAAGLAGKANTVHAHAIADTTGLQAALDAKLDDSLLGAANGVASLDADGVVPVSMLPAGSVRPEDFGAIGDGVADDTAALQAAFTAAITAGTSIDLKPVTTYKVTDTIDLRPVSGTQFRTKITGHGNRTVTWAGANGTDAARKYVFLLQGVKRTRIESVNVQIPNDATYVHAWELDDKTGAFTSLSQTTFADCHVFGNATNTGCGGWRVGHSDVGGDGDFSFIDWRNCGTAFSGTAPAGTFHLSMEGRNALNNNLFGGYAYFCASAVTNRSTVGATANGNASIFAYGFGASNCTVDFDIATPGTYVIHGGRFEAGKRFLNVNLGGSNKGADVVMTGLTIASYAPADGIVFYADGGSGLTMDSLEVRPADASPDYTAAMITLGGSSVQRSTLSIRGGRYRVADPMWTITGSASWSINRLGARLVNAARDTTAVLRNFISQSGTETNDVLTLATGITGAAGGSPSIALQPASPAISAGPRGRVGYDGSAGGPFLDGVGGRDAFIRANSANAFQAKSDTRAQLSSGLVRKRTVPGAYPYTILLTDYYVAVTTGTPKGLTLPAASAAGAGHEIVVKDISGGANTNNITITPNGTDTIDGAASRVINTAYGSVTLISSGSAWEVVNAR